MTTNLDAVNGHLSTDKWPAVLLASSPTVIVLLFAFFYGFSYRISGNFLFSYFLIASAAFFGICLIVVLSILRSRREKPHLRPDILNRMGAFAVWAVLSTTVYFYNGDAYIPDKIAIPLVTIVFLGLLWRTGAKSSIFFLTATGTALFCYATLDTNLDVKAANMLPIIQAGCADLAEGSNPFLALYPDIATAPLYYLPGTVIPYCPMVWLGQDIRWLNVLIFLVMLGILLSYQRFFRNPGVAALTTLPLLFSSMSFQMGYYGHVWMYWLAIVLLGLAWLKGRNHLVFLLLGIALLTRQMGLFLIGMFSVILFARSGLARSVLHFILAIGIFLAGMMPILLFTEVALTDFFYGGIKTASNETHGDTINPMDQVSLAGPFVHAGLRDHLLLIQAGVACVIFGLFMFSKNLDRGKLLVLTGVSYIFIIAFSAFLHRYFYVPGLLLMLLGISDLFAGRYGSSAPPNTAQGAITCSKDRASISKSTASYDS
ncbi:MAG: hypothetical protein U5S82_12910 [Gammaproteobacteria bacterium]|nr:hypothetical protein [Gammaproteobacteria bacterium]